MKWPAFIPQSGDYGGATARQASSLANPNFDEL